jgi:hypothetical protein
VVANLFEFTEQQDVLGLPAEQHEKIIFYVIRDSSVGIAMAAGWTTGVKRPGSEADHSPPSSAEVKNGGAMPPLPHTFK